MPAVDFDVAALTDDPLLDCWFTASAARRAACVAQSAFAAHYLGAFVETSVSATALAFCAATHDRARVLRWCLDRDARLWRGRMLLRLLLHLLVRLLERLLEQRWGWIPTDVACCALAAQHGHLNCLRLAHEHAGAWHKETCSRAAKNGHLACLAYAHEHGCVWDRTTCTRAALHGQLACLAYAHEHGCPWNKDTCDYAAENGHLDCLTYAHDEHGCPWDEENICSIAAQYGHLDCLTYAREHGCPWDGNTCAAAAWNGHLACLAYAHERGCVWDNDTCTRAAEGGRLACLAYARERGCPWNADTCRFAAQNGHLDCLTYAHERGCPWDEFTCSSAAANRAPGLSGVRARARLPLGQLHLPLRLVLRAPRLSRVRARSRAPPQIALERSLGKKNRLKNIFFLIHAASSGARVSSGAVGRRRRRRRRLSNGELRLEGSVGVDDGLVEGSGVGASGDDGVWAFLQVGVLERLADGVCAEAEVGRGDVGHGEGPHLGVFEPGLVHVARQQVGGGHGHAVAKVDGGGAVLGHVREAGVLERGGGARGGAAAFGRGHGFKVGGFGRKVPVEGPAAQKGAAARGVWGGAVAAQAEEPHHDQHDHGKHDLQINGNVGHGARSIQKSVGI